MMNQRQRPLSPHLQIYRLPLTGLISISHRISGIFLSLALPALVYLLISIAAGETRYQQMQSALQILPVQILYGLMIYALLLHLCHGVRHLIWDFGAGFARNHLIWLALIEVISALALTGLWLFFTL